MAETPKDVSSGVEVAASAADQLAANIERLSTAARALLNSRLQKKTIVILLQDATGIDRREITALLDALPNLDHWYLKPLKAPQK